MPDFRRRWWEANHQVLRYGLINPARWIMWPNSHSEGTIPDTRPLLLVPVHRTSIDIYAISLFIRKFVAYVSTDSFGHNRDANFDLADRDLDAFNEPQFGCKGIQ